MTDAGGRSRAWRETLRAGERLRDLERGLDRRRAAPPAPGDLYVLGETAGHPVEWLVVEEDAVGARTLLLAPADTHPLVGSGDVEIRGGASGGPLAVRCRFAGWAAAAVVAAGRRTGGVPAEMVERVRERCRTLAAGTAAGTALEREADEELEYRDWIDDVVAPARAAVDAAAAVAGEGPGDRSPSPPAPERRRSRGGRASESPPRRSALRRMSGGRARWAEAVAALFLLATVGLSIWVAGLRREVATLSRPVAGVVVEEALFGEGTRGPLRVTVTPGVPYLVLYVVLGGDVPVYDRYQLRLTDRHGVLLFASEPFAGGPYTEHTLGVPRRTLAQGVLRLELHGVSETGPVLLEEQLVTLDLGPGEP